MADGGDIDDVTALRIRKIGNSIGVIFPKELVHRLRLTAGDHLHVVEQTGGEFKLSPYDPKHAEAMALARKAFRDYADTYRELAK